MKVVIFLIVAGAFFWIGRCYEHDFMECGDGKSSFEAISNYLGEKLS